MTQPHIVEIDMGWLKPAKFAIWFPYPVYRTKTGREYYIHPKQRFKTKEKAEIAMKGRAEG